MPIGVKITANHPQAEVFVSRRHHIRLLDFRLALLVFLVIAAIFLITGYWVVQRTRNFYLSQMAAEAHRLAGSYSQQVVVSAQAEEIVASLLAAKIEVAGDVIVQTERPYSDALLSQLAEVLGVDEIYAYTPDGVIRHASNGRTIGWTATPDHPVHTFMVSGQASEIGPIRSDTESGVYYQYGYFRTSDGGFIQIGVLADKIQALLSQFELQKMLGELAQSDYIQYIGLADAAFNPPPDSPAGLDWARLMSPDAREAIQAGEDVHATQTVAGIPMYFELAPVLVDGELLGALVLGHDMHATNNLIRNVTTAWLAALGIIFLLVMATLIGVRLRNRLLFQEYYFNPLTGLPNRHYLDASLGSAPQADTDGALILINCQNMSLVNTLYGYAFGDQMIRSLANELKQLIREPDQLIHMISDRFVALIRQSDGRDGLVSLCDHIQAAAVRLYPDKKLKLAIAAVECHPGPLEPDKLIRQASLVLRHHAGQNSQACYFYDQAMEETLERQDQIEAILRSLSVGQGLEQFSLVYQPIVDLKTMRIAGFEALSRLKTARLGFVPPPEFIAIAEQTQLIVPLGQRVLRLACRFIADLTKAGFGQIRVSVNISALELLRDAFVPDLDAIVRETSIDSANLGVELTESVFSDNIDLINERFMQLKARNIRIAIDDFGTGYSSLSRERDLAVDAIKIDKSFIDRLLDLEPDQAMTGDIVSLAHRMGHLAIAEGVEFENQRAYLQSVGCDLMQGYLFSKPVDAKTALDLLQRQNEG